RCGQYYYPTLAVIRRCAAPKGEQFAPWDGPAARMCPRARRWGRRDGGQASSDERDPRPSNPVDGLHSGARRLQRSPRKQQIFPRLRLVGQIAQEISGMVSHNERHALVTVNAAAQARDRRIDIEQRRRGALSQRDDDLRTDQSNLPIEVWPAS